MAEATETEQEVKIPADNYFVNDVSLNELYPLNIRILANRHWTPLHVARQVAGFLAGDGCKILDIGSGVGKFCLAGAYYAPNSQFYGVEQRELLVQTAEQARKTLGLPNVSFIHGNFTQLNFRKYDHFYFFNSFFENLDDSNRIDDGIEYSEALFEYYVRYLYKELQQMPRGTKIATYHTFHGEIPTAYERVESHQNGDLIFWIKK